MVEWAVQEIVGRQTESTLEKGHQDNDLIGVWHGDVLILGWSPLKDGTRREEVDVDKLEELTFIDDWHPKHVGMWGVHGNGARIVDWAGLEEKEGARKKKTVVAVWVRVWKMDPIL
jgi:hypothetical protein